MAKKLIQKYLPAREKITENRLIKMLGPRLQSSSLWHINRRSFSGALALGVFCAFVPVPFQMLLAAIGAVLFRVNILISVPMVWLSNPITIPPIFYFCYLTGAFLMGKEASHINFELSAEWLKTGFLSVWQPFLLGCFIVGTVGAFITYIAARLYWRYHVYQAMLKRKKRNLALKR